MLYIHWFKPFVDRVVALLLGLACLPILFVLYFLVKLDSKGPFLFIQKRVGKNGQVFSIYKVRSMTYNPQNSGAYFTDKNDNRITKVGAYIRKTSLDELPQIFNLIKGDMSLIGVRPDTLAQKNNYTESEWSRRHTLIPGITGLAQSTLRSSATPKQRLKYDLFYAGHANFCLDMIIIYRTLKTIFKKGMQN